MPGAKRKIAILGGGVGALTTAFELTNYDGWRADHDVTVYQMGWRLGGKGASGRNGDVANRIEEHGLHFWMGFYENAFHVIRQVYDECRLRQLMPNSPFQYWEYAFTRQDTATAMEQVDGTWKAWSMYHPPNPFLPGDPNLFLGESLAPNPSQLYRALLRWLSDCALDALPDVGPFTAALPPWASALLGSVASPIRTAIHAAAALTNIDVDDPSHDNRLHDLAEIFHGEFLDKVNSLGNISDAVRRASLLLDAGMAMARGMIADNVLLGGFESIDQYDLVEWLQKHGMKKWPNAFVIAGYDTAFAYEKGNAGSRNISAGVALYGALRMMLTYRGSLFWRMNAGMGDIVFSPLYLVLRARGVKFKFFHRVTALHLSPNKQWIESIDVNVQANPLPGTEYNPLITVGGHPCWPAEPLYEQLANANNFKGENLESDFTTWHGTPQTLRRHDDFDDVVLGIPVGALKSICQELISEKQQWANMVNNIGTVQTQALQLWTNRSAEELGFPAQNRQPACITAFAKPFDTWADMSHVIQREEWKPEDRVKHIGYFCTALPDPPNNPSPVTDPTFPQDQLKLVKNNSLQFLENEIRGIWPNSGQRFDWSVLVDKKNGVGPARLESQYFRANIDGSERYVLSLKGTTKYRLHPEASGFANLFLAGDWTWNLLNCGCVEAAAISGKLAARAMCGHPTHIFGAFGRTTLQAPMPAAAAAVAATSAGEIRAKWRRLLLASLPPQNEPLRRCQAITARYARWYRENPEIYKWAGVAAFACYRIGLALAPYNAAKAAGPASRRLVDDLDFLRMANNAFFEEVGWALLAYISPGGGFNEVQLGLADQDSNHKLLQAFTKIEDAKSRLGTASGDALIWEATHLIEEHGQLITQQQFWENIDRTFNVFMTVFTLMDYDADPLFSIPWKTTSFSTYMWTPRAIAFVLSTMKLTPNIAHPDHRWYWIQNRVIPLWKQVESSDPQLKHNLTLLGGQ